nr:uncharacterized protein LOC118075709 [Zootoca vivipara]
MGGGGSKGPMTPLQCMLNNFDKGFSGDYGIEMTPERLRNLCELDWPTQGTGWPSEGSFDRYLVGRLWANIIKDKGGHPDQIPFVDSWLNVIIEDPPWLKKCKTDQCKVMALGNEIRGGQVGKCLKKPIYQGPEAEVLAPPPYVPSAVVAPLGDQGQAPHVPNAPPLPQYVAPGAEAGGGVPSASPESKGTEPTEQVLEELYPNLKELREKMSRCRSSTTMYRKAEEAYRNGRNKALGDYIKRSRSTAEAGAAVLTPLRVVWDNPPPAPPAVQGGQGGAQVDPPRRTFTLQYVPFTTTDLMNWKTHTPAFAEKPQAMVDLLSSIFAAHEPTWPDCQQLLSTLFTSEERRRINSQACEHLKDQQVAERDWPGRYPLTDPHWDPNVPDQRTALTTYRETLLHGVRRAARKPTDLSKVSTVTQKPDESPGDFLERLMEAYRIWTPFDPEDAAHELMVNASFIGQCAKDIRTKIQKQAGFQGMSRSQIMAIAQKVFEQRGDVEKREKKQWMKEKAAVIAAAMAHTPVTREVRRNNSETRGRGGGRGQALGRNQCAVCKREGHWKAECPQNQPGRRGEDRGRDRRGRIVEGRYARGPDRTDLVGLAAMGEYQD